MNFFKKIFKNTAQEKEEIKQQPVNLSLDDNFVHHFINKGGKFLYCTNKDEVISNLKNILLENNWKKLICTDIDLPKFLTKIDVNLTNSLKTNAPFFTTCEHLIANKGDILFSSNQLRSKKLTELSDHFIVYATTSQIVKDTGEALTGIKTNFGGNIPTNISAVKEYTLKKNDDNFMNYGNSNSKNLYLLLFEDL
ncbi:MULTISPECIES: hypothetical protein [Tenacibaculum]|uniref:hypothetical protein n=1 Tax=Tenacibaculum TaxID=104267 RepID=UPI001F0B2B1B|nr:MULTISPECIES: hypothetical protein [Tenacibaculum]MCH3882355.1 hypothetical protein [Tenacibaculum aquimarinum]MDO6600175.1 hypothetical protein [Tenacibaculum sp. 1_MG-2023]